MPTLKGERRGGNKERKEKKLQFVAIQHIQKKL